MALRREMNNSFGSMFCQGSGDQLLIADIPMHEHMIWISLKRSQIAQITRIRQSVHVDNAPPARANPMQYKIRPNKASSTSDQDSSVHRHSIRLVLRIVDHLLFSAVGCNVQIVRACLNKIPIDSFIFYRVSDWMQARLQLGELPERVTIDHGSFSEL